MKGHRFSKDYERLFDLAMAGQIIVCFSDYDWTDGTILRDVCKTRRWGDTISISARGVTYIHALNKEDFIEQCETCHLEFLDPADIEELAGALREIVESIRFNSYHPDYDTVQIDKAEQLLKKYEDSK